jgi:DNA primase
MPFDPSCVDVEHFLDQLGVDNISKATQYEFRMSCPFVVNHGGGDETPSCYMNENTSAFFCHGCKERGTAIDMASYVLSITLLEAIRLLKQAYQPGGINPDARDIVDELKRIFRYQETRIAQPILPQDLVDVYAMDWGAAYAKWQSGEGFQPCNYFFERGFLPGQLAVWGFGWDEMSQRIVFPVYDEDSNLIGFKGRATDGRKPKYLVLGDPPNRRRYGFPRYYPSHVVFGAHRWPQGTNDPLVVCEGELNAIAVRQKCNVPAVAINGSFFQPWHAKVIRRIANAGVILFLDNDKAGQDCVRGHFNAKGEWKPGIVELLKPHMPVYLALADDKDAADMGVDELHAHLSNARYWLDMEILC